MTIRWAVAVFLFWLAIGLSVMREIIRAYLPTTLAASGLILGEGNLAMLEPEQGLEERSRCAVC